MAGVKNEGRDIGRGRARPLCEFWRTARDGAAAEPIASPSFFQPEVKGFGLSPNPHDVIYDVMFVLDTNVLVAGLFSRRGASFWLLERILDGRLSIAVSVALALEYEDVLMRPTILTRGWADAEQISTVLDAILAQAVLVQPIRISRRPALPDPGDDLVLDCALEANADAIVTMNVRDFAAAFETYRLNILKPGELVAKLRKEEQ